MQHLQQSEDGWANIGAEIGNKEVLGERDNEGNVRDVK